MYAEKGEHAKAIPQLLLALELQPNDAETHQAVIACYDRQNDPEGVIRQMLQSVQLSRRDIKRYEELGRALQGCAHSKAPGLDGLPKEVYDRLTPPALWQCTGPP